MKKIIEAKKRDSRFELLRILSMFFIVISHFSMYGNYNFKSGNLHTLKVMQFQPWGQIGVYLFVMITGYFLSSRKMTLKLAWSKIKPLWIKVWFYSVLIFLICVFLFKININIKNIIQSIFPVVFSQYWFMTCFFILMLITPFLNYMINSLDKTTFSIYLIIILFVADVMFLINNFVQPFGNQFSVGVMISAYLIAGYIKRFNITEKVIYSVILLVFGLALQYLSMYCLSILKSGDKEFICHFTYGIFPLISAVAIFLIFLRMRAFYSKIINFFASSVLAAYLITTHQMIGKYFWNNLLNVPNLQFSDYFSLYGVVVSLLIIIFCCLIDKLYVLIVKMINRK